MKWKVGVADLIELTASLTLMPLLLSWAGRHNQGILALSSRTGGA